MESTSFAIVQHDLLGTMPGSPRTARLDSRGPCSSAGIGIVTVRQVEAGVSEPRRATIEVIRRAFEGAGVEFIDENGGGLGVRLRKRQGKKG